MLVLVLAVCIPIDSLAGDSSPQNSVGKQIPAFKLSDYLGTIHKSSKWANKSALVVIFIGVECPVAKLFGDRLAALSAKYESQDVAFVAIDSNQQDSLAEIAHYAREHKIEFPILKDPGNKVADLFQAERTPEAFVLDQTRKVRYQGLIDDQYGVGYIRTSASKKPLAAALDDLLADRDVRQPFTQAVGCRIGRVHRGESRGTITYAKDVAPILHKSCVPCHRSGQIAPFSLTSYEEVIGWAETIRDVVTDGRMPPWHANPSYGQFSNDARLPDAEKNLLLDWVKNGCPEGDPALTPKLPEFVDAWRIPKPDVVYKMPEPFEVPAAGVVPYQYFTLDASFPEDCWVKGAEMRPGNRSVVHHLSLFFHPGGVAEIDPLEVLGNVITGFTPGTRPVIFPEGTCRRIPAGSKLIIQAHYTPNGTAQLDQSDVGLLLSDVKSVRKTLAFATALSNELSIPPGMKNYSTEAVYTFKDDSLLYSLQPHMHLRGKSFCFTAHFPNGRDEVLLDVPRYDFNWQHSYLMASPRAMPAGTCIHCTAIFDNSASNLANPDPTVTVEWGEQTWDEMMVATMGICQQDEDLSVGPPACKPLAGGFYEVQFKYRVKQPAHFVYVTGSFNDWNPSEFKMVGPDPEGWYRLPMKLRAGEYEYVYVVDGNKTRLDPGNARRGGELNMNILRVGGERTAQ